MQPAAPFRLPYPPYLWRVSRGSAGLWVLVRIAYSVVTVVGAALLGILTYDEIVGLVLHPNWATRASLVATAAVMVWWDRRRSHELLLHANLGAWPGWFWAASLLAAAVLDVAVQTLIAAF